MLINKHSLKAKLIHLGLVAAFVTPIAVAASPIASASFENGTPNCQTSDTLSGESLPGASNGTGGGGVGVYQYASADKINNMRTVLQHMNQVYGFGQDQLAVIASVAWRESGWDIKAENPSGGVVGLFQWGSNGINGDRIHPAGADPANMTVDSTIKVLDYEIKEGHVAQATSMNAAMATAGNDANKAFVAWAKFEGLAISDGQNDTSGVLGRLEDTKKTFDTDSMKIDQSKIDALPKTAGGGANSATGDSGDTSGSSSNDCGDSTSSGADGTGSVSEPAGSRWKPSDVPTDVKQYIHDPEKVGLKYNSSEGWLPGISDGTQCTDFAESYFNLIWGLNMKSGVQGNGEAVADAEAAANGGSVTKTPKAGAIGSVPANSPGGYGSAGHVFVVEHVLANQDIIVSEQNMTGVSGELAGMSHSWNYRIISKDTYTSGGYKFYTPDGKTLNWGK